MSWHRKCFHRLKKWVSPRQTGSMPLPLVSTHKCSCLCRKLKEQVTKLIKQAWFRTLACGQFKWVQMWMCSFSLSLFRCFIQCFCMYLTHFDWLHQNKTFCENIIAPMWETTEKLTCELYYSVVNFLPIFNVLFVFQSRENQSTNDHICTNTDKQHKDCLPFHFGVIWIELPRFSVKFFVPQLCGFCGSFSLIFHVVWAERILLALQNSKWALWRQLFAVSLNFLAPDTGSRQCIICACCRFICCFYMSLLFLFYSVHVDLPHSLTLITGFFTSKMPWCHVWQFLVCRNNLNAACIFCVLTFSHVQMLSLKSSCLWVRFLSEKWQCGFNSGFVRSAGIFSTSTPPQVVIQAVNFCWWIWEKRRVTTSVILSILPVWKLAFTSLVA